VGELVPHHFIAPPKLEILSSKPSDTATGISLRLDGFLTFKPQEVRHELF
jgi:hypothetical protein